MYLITSTLLYFVQGEFAIFMVDLLHLWLMCGDLVAMMSCCFSIAVEVTAHMALDATVLRAGAAIRAHVHAQMPIDAELAINMATWKVNAKLKLPAKVRTRQAWIIVLIHGLALILHTIINTCTVSALYLYNHGSYLWALLGWLSCLLEVILSSGTPMFIVLFLGTLSRGVATGKCMWKQWRRSGQDRFVTQL